MSLIVNINKCFGFPARMLALALVLFAVAFLAACADEDPTQPAASPQPTATSTSAPVPTAVPSPDTAPDEETATPSRPHVQVVATSNIVADWAEVIGGDRVEVFSLHSPGSDPHNLVPGAGDVAKVADADVVFSIGLGLEAVWFEELVHNASVDPSKIVALGDGVDPLEFVEIHDHHDDHDAMEEDDHDHDEEEDDHDHDEEEDDHDHDEEEDDHDHDEEEDDHDHDEEEDDHDHDEEEDDHDHDEEEDDHDAMEEGHDDHDHDHGPLDPHFWFDPNRVKTAVNDIAARLASLDPEGAGIYFRNAVDYGVQLDELHSWTQEQVELIPPERRVLVTSHDTFAYFADVYGFKVIGAIIPSLAPDVEPSAEHLAELVEVIREYNAPAVFSETTVSGKLPEALATEAGAVFAQLYADSLGEKDSPAGTYLGMVRSNVETLVATLR